MLAALDAAVRSADERGTVPPEVVRQRLAEWTSALDPGEGFPLFSEVVLLRDVPDLRLRQGDLLRLVDRHVASNSEVGYSAEVLGAEGKVLAVVALPASAFKRFSPS